MPTPSDLRAAAQAVLDNAEADDDPEGQYIDYLVPAGQIEGLHAALRAAIGEAPVSLSWPAAVNGWIEAAHHAIVRDGSVDWDDDQRLAEAVAIQLWNYLSEGLIEAPAAREAAVPVVEPEP